CGRIHYQDVSADGAIRDGRDDRVLADVPSQKCTYTEFGPANVLSEVSSPFLEGDPSLSPDELTIYFTSDRTGGAGALDIWFARRTSKVSSFGTPEPLHSINTAANESDASFATDGLSVWFMRDNVIYFATRAQADQDFGAPQP